jgi:hypothetical protein
MLTKKAGEIPLPEELSCRRSGIKKKLSRYHQKSFNYFNTRKVEALI